MGLMSRLVQALHPKDVFHCDRCKRTYPGKWCTRSTLQSPKGTYYDECGNPCKPTARIQPLSKGRQPYFGIIDELHGYRTWTKPNKEGTTLEFKVHLNRFVKVKLTLYGEQSMREQSGGIPWVCNYKKDENGYTSFRLFELMARFGPFIYNSPNKLFEGDVVFFEGGQNDQLKELVHTHTLPTEGLSHGRCFYQGQQNNQPNQNKEVGSGMFKRTVHSKEELFKVTEALDMLRKDYTVVKETGSDKVIERDECGMLVEPKHDVWHVTEVGAMAGEGSDKQ